MTKVFFLFGAFIMLASCNFNSENVVVKPLNNSWAEKGVLDFAYNISDSQSPKNIIFVVRNNDDYPYSNLRLIASISSDNNKKLAVDTLNYILAEPNGKWIGTGFGTTKDALFQYKLNYKFPSNGRYTIRVRQAMRKNPLVGIEDFGIKIEPAKP